MTPQQEIFGAVCEALGWDFNTLTKTAKGRVGKVAAELVEVGATPEQILYAPKAWARMWGSGPDQPTLTDTAITAHWPAIVQQWERHQRAVESAERARLEEAAEAYDAAQEEEEFTEEERTANLARVNDLMSKVGLKSI